MIEALLVPMERQLHMQDGASTLTRHHATRGETTAVTRELNVVDHGDVACAGQEEIAMQRMRMATGFDRRGGSLETLSQDLSAEERTE